MIALTKAKIGLNLAKVSTLSRPRAHLRSLSRMWIVDCGLCHVLWLVGMPLHFIMAKHAFIMPPKWSELAAR